MDVKGKRVLVVGLGKSGVASALFLQARGARVTVSDAKSEEQLRSEIPTLLDKGITVETGKHGERTFRDQDLIVISPGVPFEMPQLEQARQMGVTVIGEIELSATYLQGHIIAITGSNGKTTTTTLTGEVIAAGGRKTLVGGNIGTPAITFVEHTAPDDYLVLEISSFQLETIKAFRPEISAVLNVTPDHLDRHGTFDAYAAAKKRIFENQRESDFAVLNADDPTCVAMAKGIRPRVLWFSRRKQVEQGSFVREGQIVFRNGSRETTVMPADDMTLKGAHNLENVLAAVTMGMIAGIEPPKIRRAVHEFKAVEHRLEYIATINGAQYFNDSKATNVDATIKALESFPANIHLILGGKDKGSDYTVLRDLIAQRVKRVYTIGAAAAKIESQLKPVLPKLDFNSAETLENAIKRAHESAEPGDIVLLAPACASFDQFDSFEQRGRLFKEVVAALAAKAAKGREGTA